MFLERTVTEKVECSEVLLRDVKIGEKVYTVRVYQNYGENLSVTFYEGQGGSGCGDYYIQVRPDGLNVLRKVYRPGHDHDSTETLVGDPLPSEGGREPVQVPFGARRE